MDLREKITGSEPIYKGNVVNLRLLDVELADGTQVKREMVYHNGAVAVVPFDDDGKVILVRQYRHGAAEVLLELPAGGINLGEEPTEAARRELQEEIGYTAETLIPMGRYWVAAAYTTEAIEIFIGRGLKASSLDADDDERIEMVRLPFAEALAKAHNGEIKDSKTLIGLMWAEKHLND